MTRGHPHTKTAASPTRIHRVAPSEKHAETRQATSRAEANSPPRSTATPRPPMRFHRRSTRASLAAQPRTLPASVLTTPAPASSRRHPAARAEPALPGLGSRAALYTLPPQWTTRSSDAASGKASPRCRRCSAAAPAKAACCKRDGLVASVVPSAPDSPALNAAVALDPQQGARRARRARGHLRRRGRPPLGGVDRRRRARRHRRVPHPGPGDRVRLARAWAR